MAIAVPLILAALAAAVIIALLLRARRQSSEPTASNELSPEEEYSEEFIRRDTQWSSAFPSALDPSQQRRSTFNG